jgi:phosphatidylinositol kinase/protein kinase (PI-3  family)
MMLSCADFRLDGCQREVDTWQRILQIRSMVLTPKDDMKTWLQFADLCRTSDRLALADKTLTALVGSDTLDPDVSNEYRGDANERPEAELHQRSYSRTCDFSGHKETSKKTKRRATSLI